MNVDELTALLTSVGVSGIVHKPSHPHELLALCPLHDDSNPSFSVSTVKDGHPANCFAECFRGSIITFVSKMLDVSFKEALTHCRKYGDIEAPVDLSSFGPKKTEDQRLVHWSATSIFSHNNLQNIDDYDAKLVDDFLFTRYLSRKHLTEYCGWNSSTKSLNFSWVDSSGLIRGLSFRELVSPYRKQFDPMFKHPGECLFYPELPKSLCQTLVVVEGPLDALAVRAHTGLPVCALGHAAPSDHQVKMICNVSDRVLLLLDSDEGGQRGMDTAIRKIGDGALVLPAVTLPAKDPSRTPPAKLRKALRGLLTSNEKHIRSKSTNSPPGVIRGKRSTDREENGSPPTFPRRVAKGAGGPNRSRN